MDVNFDSGLSAFLCPRDMVPDRGVYIGKESILQNVLSAKGVCCRSLCVSGFIRVSCVSVYAGKLVHLTREKKPNAEK